jgi:hypothetical protein
LQAARKADFINSRKSKSQLVLIIQKLGEIMRLDFFTIIKNNMMLTLLEGKDTASSGENISWCTGLF